MLSFLFRPQYSKYSKRHRKQEIRIFKILNTASFNSELLQLAVVKKKKKARRAFLDSALS